MTERITSNEVHDYVEWLRETAGFDVDSSEDACGIVVINKKGDTRLSHAGKPREIKDHFLKGYLIGYYAAKKIYEERDDHEQTSR